MGAPPETADGPADGALTSVEEFDASLRALREATPTVVSAPLPPPAEAFRTIPTFVKGLDRALGGGIPEGHVVLLEGSPGTMKSSLACWMLAHNAVHEHRLSVYLSFEESASSLLRQMRSLGVSLEGTSDRLTIVDSGRLAAVRSGKAEWLDALNEIVEPLCHAGVGLLVLDSLEALDMIVGFRDRRDELFRLFEFLRDLRLTSLIIAERSEAHLGSRDPEALLEEDFLADGIIQLRLYPIGKIDVHRRLRICKMRGLRHETDSLALHAGSGELEVVRILGG